MKNKPKADIFQSSWTPEHLALCQNIGNIGAFVPKYRKYRSIFLIIEVLQGSYKIYRKYSSVGIPAIPGGLKIKFFNINLQDRVEPEQEVPKDVTEWYVLTKPSGEQQLVHCSQLGKLHGKYKRYTVGGLLIKFI